MRRKVIKQGSGEGFTVYLPKKWATRIGLKHGSEIEVSESGNDLVVSPVSIERQRKTIGLDIKKSAEITPRVLIVNAYRAGFDEIDVSYDGELKEIYDIVDNYLIGFEAFPGKNSCSLRSVSEPSYDQFESMINRQFFIVMQILDDLKDPEVERWCTKMSKYDIFLRRCISKDLFSTEAKTWLWHFLVILHQIGRACFYCHKDIAEGKVNIDKTVGSCINSLKEMFGIVQSFYLKRDTSLAKSLHEAGKKNQEEFYRRLGEQPLLFHHLLMLTRFITLAVPPLVGLILTESEKRISLGISGHRQSNVTRQPAQPSVVQLLQG
ncbi:MAG: hypothetical protein ABH879_03080 [archaeon]